MQQVMAITTDPNGYSNIKSVVQSNPQEWASANQRGLIGKGASLPSNPTLVNAVIRGMPQGAAAFNKARRAAITAAKNGKDSSMYMSSINTAWSEGLMSDHAISAAIQEFPSMQHVPPTDTATWGAFWNTIGMGMYIESKE